MTRISLAAVGRVGQGCAGKSSSQVRELFSAGHWKGSHFLQGILTLLLGPPTASFHGTDIICPGESTEALPQPPTPTFLPTQTTASQPHLTSLPSSEGPEAPASASSHVFPLHPSFLVPSTPIQHAQIFPAGIVSLGSLGLRWLKIYLHAGDLRSILEQEDPGEEE